MIFKTTNKIAITTINHVNNSENNIDIDYMIWWANVTTNINYSYFDDKKYIAT